MSAQIVILAAGAGRRLHSRIPKPLISMAGKPLMGYVLETARKLSPQRLVVVCPPDPAFADAVRAMDSEATIAVQPKPLGTADALRCAVPHLNKKGAVLVLCADTPLLTAASLKKLLPRAATAPALLTFTAHDPLGYGRIVREGGGEGGAVQRIVEQRDATAAEREINEVYSGVMALPVPLLSKLLGKIGDKNAAGERYLTDIAALATAAGLKVQAVRCSEEECAGVNDAEDVEFITRLWRWRCTDKLMARGVRLADASRVDVRGTVRAGRDVEIDVNVILEGTVVLGDNCRIGANCVLRNCRIGADTVIEPFSHLEDAVVGARCSLGPYARLRPGSHLAADVHIGNFVEVKNSRLKAGVKAGHLSYLGDSSVGERTNIGAGTITCNYDGKKKHRTVIGDDVFVGSDTQLIAPVTIGRGAYIGAGSTITKPVPPKSMAIGRGRQINRRRP